MSKLTLLGLAAIISIAGPLGAATLSCNNSSGQPSGSVVGYSFDVSVPINSGGGGSAGKATTSLVVQLPLTASYPAIYKIAVENRISSSCTLTQDFGSGTVVTTLQDVEFSDVKLLSGNYYTNYTPGPVVELTLVYAKIQIN